MKTTFTSEQEVTPTLRVNPFTGKVRLSVYNLERPTVICADCGNRTREPFDGRHLFTESQMEELDRNQWEDVHIPAVCEDCLRTGYHGPLSATTHKATAHPTAPTDAPIRNPPMST